MKKLMFLIFLCFFCPTSYADVSTGLVGWWKFDEAVSGACGAAPNILDASGNANTGTCHNNPTWIAGQIGRGAGAFVAATDQYVQTTAATNIPAVNGTLTYSAWVHCTTLTAVQDILVTTNQTDGNQLRLTATTGFLQVSQWAGTSIVTATNKALTTTGWYMVTWTSNGTTTQNLYVNGALATSTFTAAPQTASPTPTSVVIGSYDAGEYFNGDIDDVRIYNRVLSAADITQLYDYYTGRNGLFSLMAR